MKIIETRFSGVYLIEEKLFEDARGFFTETYNKQLFLEFGLNFDFIQDNHSLSREKGTIRGLHYQLNPKTQTKLVRVTRGAVFDVVVDLRKGSSTYGKWQGFNINETNKRQLLIPKGFAHGFCTLVENTEVQYKVDEYYSPDLDRGILWEDKVIGIEWPVTNPILSAKDKKHPVLSEAEINFIWEADR